MRKLLALVLTLLITLATVSPASARVVLMQASAALESHTEPAIEDAFRSALQVVVNGALAMGMQSMRVDRASVLDDTVIVWVVATDEEGDDPDSVDLKRVTR